jgi:hypothetical protein
MALNTDNVKKVKVGLLSGFTGQGSNAIAIGYNAGYTNQGDNSIAIGANSSAINSDNSIVIGTGASSKLDISNQLVIGFDASNNSYGGIYGVNLGKNNFKLGINTNSPIYDLDISGILRVSNKIIAYDISSSYASFINLDLSYGNITNLNANNIFFNDLSGLMMYHNIFNLLI